MKITISTLMRRGARAPAALAGRSPRGGARVPAATPPFAGRAGPFGGEGGQQSRRPPPCRRAGGGGGAQFADEGCNQVWTGPAAQSVRGGRPGHWGPQRWFDYAEFYRQGANGLRSVQYFDKARMEVNNPGDRSVQDGVTNGLLVVEL